MVDLSSAEAAKKVGITPAALSKYIKQKKVPAPRIVQVGRLKVQAWNEEEIERLRRLLPKIANGRKTRYQKLRDKRETQARAPALQKPKKQKKKK